MFFRFVYKTTAETIAEIEEDEREIESELDRRGLNNMDANYGRRSQNSEQLQSIRSSQDFWQKIESKYHKKAQRERTIRAKNELTLNANKEQAMQKKQGGLEGQLTIDANCHWNASTDGHICLKYENNSFYVFVTIFGLAL